MIQSALLMAAGQADLDLSEGPDAAPSNPSAYTYQGTKIGVQWVNGDLLAETQIALNDGSAPGVDDIVFTAPAGASSLETGYDANTASFRCTWWVRHARNGQFSAWSDSGTHVDGCTPPIGAGGEEDPVI